MSDIDRYRIDCFENFEAHPEGDLVFYEDVEKLQAENKIYAETIIYNELENVFDMISDHYEKVNSLEAENKALTRLVERLKQDLASFRKFEGQHISKLTDSIKKDMCEYYNELLRSKDKDISMYREELRLYGLQHGSVLDERDSLTDQ